MKISKIEQEYDIFIVTFTPTWVEKLFGLKTQDIKYRDSGREFVFGGGTVYVKQDGSKLPNGHIVGTKIDEFRRRF